MLQKQEIIFEDLGNSRVELVCTYYADEADRIKYDTYYKHCLYAYLYPNHPLFIELKTEVFWDYDIGFSWHGGATYSRFYYDEKGDITVKKIGCDYSHLHDLYSICREKMHYKPMADFEFLKKYLIEKGE